MRKINLNFILIAVLFLCSCGLKNIFLPVPVQLEPADELFSKAEKLYQVKSYEKALSAYNEYISRFPDGSFADAVLIKTGAIYTALEDYEKARDSYKRLLVEYPDSSFVPDARVEGLVTFYNEGKYEKVIREADSVLGKIVSRIHILRMYVLVGDSYIAISSPLDALHFYTLAFDKSKDLERETVISKLKEAVVQLDKADIMSIIKNMGYKPPAGMLMYLYGLKKAEEEQYDDALMMLSDFVDRFPEHKFVEQAKNLIEELSKKSVYSRYTIGCLLPLSGSYKDFGCKALKGIELALEQFCSQGDQPSIKIIIKDTGSEPDVAANAVKELFEEHVAAIIGPIFTAESAALEAQSRGIPIVTITQKDNITDTGDYVFRNFFSPRMQVETIVSYAIEELELKKFAILYPDENYGKVFMNLFWDEVVAYGGKVVGVESYKLNSTDFADPIKKLVGLYHELPKDLENTGELIEGEDKSDDYEEEEEGSVKADEPEPIIDFDAIFIPDSPKRAGLIIPQLSFYDVNNVYLFGTNLWHSDILIKMAHQYVQNAIMPDIFFAESSSEKVKDFVRTFEKTFREKPGFIEAIAYDTAMMLFQIVSRPDVRFRSAVKNELMKLSNFQGVTGLTSFDSNGELKKDLYLLKIKGNKFVELK
ncbi:MAG: penicillin-binding protein activator [Proteobacteria bacterium]|nr:ABC transporter substrate-binding protein [Desulfobacteraceae bacterium]MBU2520679.1 penicillin-binding protein activator [Pseudomonadota bacterium]MBU3979887.1 penicillin-binding protein activator [Pseudomonadota bacterium]MBU4011944.1 penicillin-binding protein activator [Pseudomonadota bacterium]MBU4067969.1 penicillin-binding protein activator [Pseudomonadota bacterium]